MKNLKTAILIFCLLAGACLADSGPSAYAERVTEEKATEEAPVAEMVTPAEEEALPPAEAEGDGEASEAGTDDAAVTANDPKTADTPLPAEAEEMALASRMQRALPLLIGFGIANYLLLFFTLLLDWVPGLAAGLAGRMKLKVKEPPADMIRSMLQLEEWKNAGLISEGEYLRLRRQYFAAHRGRRGEEK